MGWPPIFTLFTISANCEALVALEWYVWWLSHYKKDMVQIESHFLILPGTKHTERMPQKICYVGFSMFIADFPTIS